MNRPEMRDYWRLKRKRFEDMRQHGKCVIYVKKTTFTVVCPFHEIFVKEASSLAGRWRHRSGQWSFPIGVYSKVFELAKSIFGINNVNIRSARKSITVSNDHLM